MKDSKATKPATIPVSPTGLLHYLEWAEVDGARAPDARRVLRDERFALSAAIRNGRGISTARDEARRVAIMWEGF